MGRLCSIYVNKRTWPHPGHIIIKNNIKIRIAFHNIPTTYITGRQRGSNYNAYLLVPVIVLFRMYLYGDFTGSVFSRRDLGKRYMNSLRMGVPAAVGDLFSGLLFLIYY